MKIIIGTSAIVLLLAVYLAATIKEVRVDDPPRIGSVNEGPGISAGSAVSHEKLVDDYQRRLKDSVAEIEAVLQAGSGENEAGATGQTPRLEAEAAQIKASLMELRVPEEYRRLHLDLVLLVDQAGDYYSSPKNPELLPDNEEIERLRLEYPWLVNS